MVLSRIDRSRTKVDWLSEIHLWRMCFSLLANTFVGNLYSTLHNAIGRQSFIDFCSSPMIISAVFVELSEGGN